MSFVTWFGRESEFLRPFRYFKCLLRTHNSTKNCHFAAWTETFLLNLLIVNDFITWHAFSMYFQVSSSQDTGE